MPPSLSRSVISPPTQRCRYLHQVLLGASWRIMRASTLVVFIAPPLQQVCNFPNYKGVHPQESPDGLWGSVRVSNFNILLIDDSEAEAKVFQSALTKVAPRTTLYWVASAKE